MHCLGCLSFGRIHQAGGNGWPLQRLWQKVGCIRIKRDSTVVKCRVVGPRLSLSVLGSGYQLGLRIERGRERVANRSKVVGVGV